MGNLDRINEGVAYLKTKGECGVDNGPNRCSRVSCSYWSAISLCSQVEDHFPVLP
jgi:pyridoxal biosynthesis lyase PdxS